MYYILKNKKAHKCKDPIKWARCFENTKNRIVKQDLLSNGYWVSTVFLGLDHNFASKGKPLIFETMIFDKLFKSDYSNLELDMDRYSTWNQAINGHNKLLNKYKYKNLFRVLLFWILNKLKICLKIIQKNK